VLNYEQEKGANFSKFSETMEMDDLQWVYYQKIAKKKFGEKLRLENLGRKLGKQ
jgi:hypothetical protein